jgi:glycosyltransferase involved in cell wall biosynthesis
MPKIDRKWIDEILVVDGWSTDGTIEYLRDNKIPFFLQEGRGTGAAFCEALARINTDYVIVFSPDGNSPPENIPKLTEICVRAEKRKRTIDIVISSRYLPPARSYDDDIITRFGNWMFTTLFNILYGTQVTDVLVMYRIYNVKRLKALSPTPYSDAFGTQALARAVKQKYRITEIPGDEPKRIGGARKMNPIKNGLSEINMMFREKFNK